MGERLTKWQRQTIARNICDYAFEKRDAALASEKPKLFREAVTETYGADVLIKVARLPSHWFKRENGISLNVDGWNYYLKVDEKHGIRVPYRRESSEDEKARPGVKDAALVARLKTHAAVEAETYAAKKNMERAVMGLLMSCSTLAAFFKVMPDAREMLGKKEPLPVQDGRSLVVSGKEIMCLVAAARNESRGGCADGKLVEAS